MQTKRIIPCLDVDEGKVVKGMQFGDLKEVGDPVELATRYYADGADELAFLDISATSKSRATLLDIVRKVAQAAPIPFCVGGGIRSLEDMGKTLDAGAHKVSIGTAALQNPSLLNALADAYGSHCVVIAIDAKQVGVDAAGHPVWHAFSMGGREDTGRNALEWAMEAVDRGVGEVLLTSIDADGRGEGYDLALLSQMVQAVSVPVIASGGAGTLDHIAEALLPLPGTDRGADAALVASMLHSGSTTIREIKQYAASQGIPVRW